MLEFKRLWAVQEFDSEYRIWKNEKNFSNLVFNWQSIGVPGMSTYHDISVAISKKNKNENREKIKSVALGIYYFSRLKLGDGILCVDGRRSVRKIGYIVSHKSEDGFRSIAEIKIKWKNEIEEVNGLKNIFNTKREIQKVTPKMLEQLDIPLTLSSIEYELPLIRRREKSIFAPFFLESESKSDSSTIKIPEYFRVTTMAKNRPILFGNLSSFEFVSEKEDKGGSITLFYGTNRNRTDSEDANEFFGDELSELKFGRCEVNIPKGHIQGEVERPVHIWFVEFSENEEKHVVLKEINETNEQDFLSRLAQDLDKLPEKSAMIFIHGYNTTFAEAARRAAQIAWDIPFQGIPGFFSWPSCGRTLAYLKDIEHADATVPFLEKFIEKIICETKIEKLHLIAHSMGNRLLVFTLNKLSVKPAITQKLKIINQIVLAAPDIDQNVFKNSFLPEIKNIGNRRTLYSSDKDQALHLSEELRGGLARLGDAGDSLFVAENVDTIDASNVKSGSNNHSYIFDEKELLTDLYYLLKNGFDPLNRRLRARKKNNLTYWLFPA
jgi:esterase/lipase superfamily enzyme